MSQRVNLDEAVKEVRRIFETEEIMEISSKQGLINLLFSVRLEKGWMCQAGVTLRHL